MAFPIVESSVSSDTGTVDGSSHTVSLPSGIVSGDLLVAMFSTDSVFPGGVTVTWPAGWTEFAAQDANDNLEQLHVAYRLADGTEGASITVTTSSNQMSCAVVYRISGALVPATQPPEAASISGTSTNPDPPNLTPTGGAKDYLWIAVAGTDNSASVNAFEGYPASYASNQHTDFNNSTGGATIAAATQNLNAASENPGTFTQGSEQWAAMTIAIHPVAAITTEYVSPVALAAIGGMTGRVYF
mgnify:CR=1 FL=1